MALVMKYRLGEVAKDFGVPNKDIAAIMAEYFAPSKNHMQVLANEELDVIFEYMTQHNQVASLEEIFQVPAPAAPAAEPEKEKADKADGKPAQDKQGKSGTRCTAGTRCSGAESADEAAQAQQALHAASGGGEACCGYARRFCREYRQIQRKV